MIDAVLISLIVVIYGLAGFRVIRVLPWDREWRPPSSRLSLFGFVTTMLLLAHFVIAHKSWYSIFFVLMSNVYAFWSYRIAVGSEVHYREYQDRIRRDSD